MTGNSRSVTSNQEDVHPDLALLLDKHQRSAYNRPVASHTQQAFESAAKQVSSAGRPLILDSGCGVGESTINLARAYPDHLVIGLDQSEHRLSRNPLYNDQGQVENALLLRADCVDFWRLAQSESWFFDKHYVLYPNPWPKKSHLKRRWHGHPVFSTLMVLSDELELRTNWQIYQKEFAWCAEKLQAEVIEQGVFEPEHYLTPFERKYCLSGQEIYRLLIKCPLNR